jgi:hypothetical protein
VFPLCSSVVALVERFVHRVHCAGLSDLHGASQYVCHAVAFLSASGSELSQEVANGKIIV